MTNGWTLGIGMAVIVVIAAAQRVDRRAPGALVGLSGSTVLVAVLGLSAHGVAVLGTIAHSAPSFGLSELSWSSIGNVLPVAAVVALVVIIQSAATTRAFSDQQGYKADVGRDFLGVGGGRGGAGRGGAVNASPPRTAAVASAGGRTQLAGLGAAAAVVVLVPAGALLKNMPLTTLAAVLTFIAIRIFHVRDLAAVLRFDVWEFGLAVVTLLTVALIGVEQGIVVAVGLAILDRTRLNARPQAHKLGATRIPPAPIEVPGVLVVLFAAPLYFANADRFRAQIDTTLSHLTSRPHALVLDVVGMHDIDFTGARALKDVLDELDR